MVRSIRKLLHIDVLSIFSSRFNKNVVMYSKSEYTLESVSVPGRPSVYTIILERLIRSSWNFAYRIVSSNLGRVRRWEWFVKKWPSYSKKCHYFLCFSIQTLTYSDFHKHFFCHNQNNNYNYYIPFDREFHGLQNGI
jgi:hypothetical protein